MALISKLLWVVIRHSFACPRFPECSVSITSDGEHVEKLTLARALSQSISPPFLASPMVSTTVPQDGELRNHSSDWKRFTHLTRLPSWSPGLAESRSLRLMHELRALPGAVRLGSSGNCYSAIHAAGRERVSESVIHEPSTR
jgi:hypothetical protein